jgi:DHA2 family multidrug resistance protein
MTTERTQVRLAHLAPHLTPLDPGYVALLGQVQQSLAQQGQAASGAAGVIYQTFRIQGAVLAYLDIFAFCAIMALCVTPVALLLGSEKASGGGGH